MKTITACPVCQRENRDSRGVHLCLFGNGGFNCVANSSKQHRYEIAQILNLKRDSGEEVEDFSVEEDEPNIPKYFDKKIVENLTMDYEYWTIRGISPEILNQLHSGVCEYGQMKGRHTFPVYNKNNKIIGLVGRAVNNKNQTPWKILGRKSNFIFPLVYKNETIKKKSVVLVESVGDCLSLLECGIKNVLVLFGLKISPTLINYLVSLGELSITISTNNDLHNLAGNNAAQEIKNTLSKFFDESKIEIKLPPLNDINCTLCHPNFGKQCILDMWG